MLHETLWLRHEAIAKRCLEVPFVAGLGDGTLDSDAFRRYVAQDAFFLRAFFKAYALAMAKSEDFEHSKAFHSLARGVVDELELHARFAAQLNIDLEHVKPCAAASAYTDFLLRVAWQGSLGEIVAAMVPCLRLYAYLGTAFQGQLRPGHPYADWIVTYASEGFLRLCSQLETLLDQLGTDVAAIDDAYRYAMECELEFFAAPLKGV